MKSLTIGRIQGIDIKLHPSFLLIALWVIYHWGFRQDYGIAGTVYGLVLVLAIFCLVLLHELGHSMMAHEYGLRVRDITLVPFGGGPHRTDAVPPARRGDDLGGRPTRKSRNCVVAAAPAPDGWARQRKQLAAGLRAIWAR
jgi:hypothetical protein